MKAVKNTIPVYDICTLIGNENQHNNIVASRLSDYLVAHPNLQFPHRHSFFHFLLFTKGSGSHTIDFEQFTIVPGQAYFMAPGQIHTWSFNDDVEGYIVNFSEELMQQGFSGKSLLHSIPFLKGIATESVFNLPDLCVAELEGYIQSIIKEQQKRDRFSEAMIASVIATMVIVVARFADINDNNAEIAPGNLILNNFRELVEQNYATLRLPREYAALLYITPNHLNAVCRQMLNKSAGEVIRERMLLEIKRWLVNAEISISEIADKLSFQDNSYFSKFFKKYEGMTPEEFKKSFKLKISQ